MDFLHNIAYIEKILMHVSNLFFAKNFLLRFLKKKKVNRRTVQFFQDFCLSIY